jgi:circadian clock protein KaiC
MERQLDNRTEIRKAMGVIKKRVSNFERTLRELQITRYGIKVSKPIGGLRGILSSAPVWIDGGADED